jgi:hypothetical protein
MIQISTTVDGVCHSDSVEPRQDTAFGHGSDS